MEKYVLLMGNKVYCETTNSFESVAEKDGRLFDTYNEASKKRAKLYKKIFGVISIKLIHI